MGSPVKNFNLPWHQHDHYWLGIFAKTGSFSPSVQAALQEVGMQKVNEGTMALQAPRDWGESWKKIHKVLAADGSAGNVEIAVIPGEARPNWTAAERKPTAQVVALADSLWLGDALLEDRLMCYLQPVVSTRDKVFGYESFARVRSPDGSIIAGDRIIAASKVLGIEYMIDRHLHVEAINTFVTSQFNGFLFVNFFPGFIHRPAVYLEGLGDTVKSFGIVARHIVLDFTKSENPHDMAHLKSVCEYGRSRGYSIALDDIESLESARKLIAEIRPDFVKIDMHLARRAGEPAKRDLIHQIVELVHAGGGTVIGEGVETEEMHQQLRALGVDLFQGYLFSPPMPVEAALKRTAV